MSGIIGADNRFAADFDHPDAAMQGDITGLYDIGCVLGSVLVYFIGERFGRRTMLLAGGAIMIAGAAVLASATTIAQLLVGRIVTGFGNGMNSSTAPVYQSECSPAHIRGALLTLQGMVTILGVVIGTHMNRARVALATHADTRYLSLLDRLWHGGLLVFVPVSIPLGLPGRFCHPPDPPDHWPPRNASVAGSSS